MNNAKVLMDLTEGNQYPRWGQLFNIEGEYLGAIAEDYLGQPCFVTPIDDVYGCANEHTLVWRAVICTWVSEPFVDIANCVAAAESYLNLEGIVTGNEF